MRLPIDVRDLVRSGSQLQEERDKPVRLVLLVEVDAPQELLDTVQSRFRPQTAAASLYVEVIEADTKLIVDPSSDAVIALVGGAGEAIVQTLAAARERAVPTGALGCGEDAAALAEALNHPYRDTLADVDVAALVDGGLGEWLVERLPAKRLSLANNYTFMRRAVAVEHIKNTAFQNALIGAIAIIPGADMPLMTANQAKMVLQIAAAYGEHLGPDRIRELLGVVGGAFLLRTAARQAVAFVPGLGWAIKGGIGYTGTIAMGHAAIKYFENGADLGDLKAKLDSYGRQVASRIRSMSRKELKAATGPSVESLPSAERPEGEPGQ